MAGGLSKEKRKARFNSGFARIKVEKLIFSPNCSFPDMPEKFYTMKGEKHKELHAAWRLGHGLVPSFSNMCAARERNACRNGSITDE
jgi:hypothetical protein